ncbi:CRISPR-associated primase-polymerase type A1 [Fervidobacterium thailandense]|uniref:TOTE conflict system primase domain-containing protein n=1 Tax=Fervidobacterium thailandense TaxID=1008305 RepID=A0A1E3G0D9_9BACT|nr:CRISPR-associated primase-polymerase type A1 [Fervidobacterium thailandense]ODN29685.1 hypothetical protein A4H02_09425 [Fervidobacterium thailandense]
MFDVYSEVERGNGMTEEESLKQKAIELEESFKFREALELYKACEGALTIEDGSLMRYAKLLFEFQEFQKAKQVLEKIILNYRYVNKELFQMLAEVYEHLGMDEKALVIYRKLGEKRKVVELENEQNFLRPNQRYVSRFMELFAGREDVFAIQTESGYYPVRRALTEADVIEHFTGKKTIGIYVLRSDDTVRFAAFDVDVKKGALGIVEKVLYDCQEVAKQLLRALEIEGLIAYPEFSGNKGYHIWLFFETPISAYKVKLVLEKIAAQVTLPENVKIEVFPKQAQTNGGLGNLIKAPLGVHRKTGKRCVFLSPQFEEIEQQMDFLLQIRKNSADVLKKLFHEYSTESGVDNQGGSQEKSSTPTGQENSPEKMCGRSKRTPKIDEITKKELRRRIAQENNPTLLAACSCTVISQIIQKIEKVAYIDDFEEMILVRTFKYLPNGTEILERLLKKTINYSTERFKTLLAQSGEVPISCEEIKKQVLTLDLALDLSKCTCKFTQPLNTPLNYLSPDAYLQYIDEKSLALKLIEKLQEKATLELEIRNLKALLASKMNDEIRTDTFVVRKSENGEIEIKFC